MRRSATPPRICVSTAVATFWISPVARWSKRVACSESVLPKYSSMPLSMPVCTSGSSPSRAPTGVAVAAPRAATRRLRRTDPLAVRAAQLELGAAERAHDARRRATGAAGGDPRPRTRRSARREGHRSRTRRRATTVLSLRECTRVAVPALRELVDRDRIALARLRCAATLVTVLVCRSTECSRLSVSVARRNRATILRAARRCSRAKVARSPPPRERRRRARPRTRGRGSSRRRRPAGDSRRCRRRAWCVHDAARREQRAAAERVQAHALRHVAPEARRCDDALRRGPGTAMMLP